MYTNHFVYSPTPIIFHDRILLYPDVIFVMYVCMRNAVFTFDQGALWFICSYDVLVRNGTIYVNKCHLVLRFEKISDDYHGICIYLLQNIVLVVGWISNGGGLFLCIAHENNVVCWFMMLQMYVL